MFFSSNRFFAGFSSCPSERCCKLCLVRKWTEYLIFGFCGLLKEHLRYLSHAPFRCTCLPAHLFIRSFSTVWNLIQVVFKYLSLFLSGRFLPLQTSLAHRLWQQAEEVRLQRQMIRKTLDVNLITETLWTAVILRFCASSWKHRFTFSLILAASSWWNWKAAVT